MPIWEYKTVAKPYDERLTEEQMNQLGAYGLELVSVFVVTETVTVVGRHESRHVVNYVFKRVKPAAQAGQTAQAATVRPAAPPAPPPKPPPA